MKSTFLFIPLLLFFFFTSLSSYGQNKEDQNRLDSIKTTLKNLSITELDSLGSQAREALNYKEAEIYFKKNVEKIKTDSLLADALQKLGNIYYLEKKFNEALPIWNKAKELQTKLGKQRMEYANACRYLALIYKEIGSVEEAEKLQLEGKDITEKIKGKNEEYANFCNDLGNIYYRKGNYIKAEEFYLESLALKEKGKDENPLDYAIGCGNLAIIYIIQGLYEKAEPLCITARTIYEKEVGNKHSHYSAFSGNLAYLYLKKQNYEKAKKIMTEIIDIKKETVGTEHLDYLYAYANLAYLYKAQEKYKETEIIFAEIREKYKKLFGKENELYARSCNDLATAYYWQGEYEKAEKFYLEYQYILETLTGKQGINYITAQSNLAILYRDKELYTKAKPYFEDVTNRVNADIILYFPTLSEKERFSYIQNAEHFFDKLTQFVIKSYPTDKSNSEMLFNQQLFTKGIVFSSTQKMKQQIFASGDTSLINKYEEWKTKKEEYVNLIQLGKTDSTNVKEKKAAQLNELEKEISKKSKLFQSNITQKQYKWQDVQAALSENEAVIEIVRFNEKNQYRQEHDTTYIALIVTKETKESPELLLLENGQELENGALSFYQNTIDFQLGDDESYNQYWKPIQDKLNSLAKISNKDSYSKIYFSPDGIYHKINLNTLQNPKTGNYLVEQETIQLITSSRDLIERAEKGIKEVDLSENFAAYKTYLLGYPAYNLNRKDTLKVNGKDRSLNGLQRLIGQQTVVPVLEGTKVETNQINDLFDKKNVKTTLFQNKEATEENIKALQNPTILHIATHGFFITQIPENKVTTMQEAENRSLLKNPFLRSGLLLAGCQNPQIGQEDGILSAEEAMNLNLEGTELVVLSACETGLGDIQNGEGVYGLQRAFRQAGAKTLIMSLWKVSDEATQLLMVTFYDEFLSGKSKREAFKIAQLKLKEKYSEPYYWGAFVMVGE